MTDAGRTTADAAADAVMLFGIVAAIMCAVTAAAAMTALLFVS